MLFTAVAARKLVPLGERNAEMFDRLMFIADFAATHSAAVDRDLAELGADLSAAELEAFCLAETQDLVSFGQPSFSRYLPAGRR